LAGRLPIGFKNPPLVGLKKNSGRCYPWKTGTGLGVFRDIGARAEEFIVFIYTNLQFSQMEEIHLEFIWGHISELFWDPSRFSPKGPPKWCLINTPFYLHGDPLEGI